MGLPGVHSTSLRDGLCPLHCLHLSFPGYFSSYAQASVQCRQEANLFLELSSFFLSFRFFSVCRESAPFSLLGSL